MRILLWHGYLLGGTGSNVYTRSIAREWSRAGHDVVVVSQEANPELHDLGGVQTVRPDIGGLLPVFVLDRYEGMQAKLLQDTSQEERDRFVEANASVLRELAPADLVFANHVLLGGPVGAASGLPFAVKAHGSELEYSMRGNEELAALGTRDARRRPSCLRRLGAHPEGARGRRRPRRSGLRGPSRRRRRDVPAGIADRGAPEPARGGRSRPTEPRERERATSRRRQCRAARGLPRRGSADGSLLRQADPEQRGAPLARGARARRRQGRDRRLRRLSRRTGGDGRTGTRSSRGRSSTGTSST